MPRREQLYHYLPKAADKASKTIDMHLMIHADSKYRSGLKSMVNDQIGAMKAPSFIAQTVYDYIDYDIKYLHTGVKIPRTVLVNLKKKLAEVLEGVCNNGLQGEEEKEKG